MVDYEIEFKYKLPEWGSVILPADNADQAEEFGLEYVKETYNDITDVEITSVRELPVVLNG